MSSGQSDQRHKAGKGQSVHRKWRAEASGRVINQEAKETAQWTGNDSRNREGGQIKETLGEWQNDGMKVREGMKITLRRPPGDQGRW